MNKTQPNSRNVDKFLNSLDDDQQQDDSRSIVKIMQKVSGESPVMWGSSIIGFGQVHYKSQSGREGDWMKIGFSPRKGKISLYITGEAEKYKNSLDAMGKYKTGKGCIYIKNLSEVDVNKLEKIIAKAHQDGGIC